MRKRKIPPFPRIQANELSKGVTEITKDTGISKRHSLRRRLKLKGNRLTPVGPSLNEWRSSQIEEIRRSGVSLVNYCTEEGETPIQTTRRIIREMHAAVKGKLERMQEKTQRAVADKQERLKQDKNKSHIEKTSELLSYQDTQFDTDAGIEMLRFISESQRILEAIDREDLENACLACLRLSSEFERIVFIGSYERVVASYREAQERKTGREAPHWAIARQAFQEDSSRSCQELWYIVRRRCEGAGIPFRIERSTFKRGLSSRKKKWGG